MLPQSTEALLKATTDIPELDIKSFEELKPIFNPDKAHNTVEEERKN